MADAKVLTVDDVKDYLSIDVVDDMVENNINRCINTADTFLKGAIGDNYPVEDARCKELALMIVSDLYDNRGIYTQVSANERKLFESIAWQIRLELRRRERENGNI